MCRDDSIALADAVVFGRADPRRVFVGRREGVDLCVVDSDVNEYSPLFFFEPNRARLPSSRE